MPFVNSDIKNTVRVFPEQGRYGMHRYDMNENPEGLPNDFVNNVLKEITPEFLAIYPEPNRFIKKYADYLGVSPENITVTNGSDMAIRYLLETFGEKGKEVVTVSPSFEMYWVNCCILGYKHIPVAYEKDFTIKVENILNAINDNTCIIVLLNPNNPMGNVYTEQEVQQIIEKAKSVNALVIIDEAYHYFYPKTFLHLALKNDNVALLRTFSKLFSIAALRLGAIIANPNIIHYVQNAKLTFDVNSIALLFGERIIEHPEMIQKLIEIENEGKKYTISELKKNGYECRDCRGNFIFIKPKHNAIEIAKRLEKESKVLVHPYNNDLLKDYLRVSIGSKKAMGFFLDEFFKIDGQSL